MEKREIEYRNRLARRSMAQEADRLRIKLDNALERIIELEKENEKLRQFIEENYK